MLFLETVDKMNFAQCGAFKFFVSSLLSVKAGHLCSALLCPAQLCSAKAVDDDEVNDAPSFFF